MNREVVIVISIILLTGLSVVTRFKNESISQVINNISDELNTPENLGGPDLKPHPLSIEALRQGEYPGSEIVIEQTLEPGSNYKRYIASYKSDGLKIYGLLTVPTRTAPESGYPAIIFNHGYIPPTQYRTTERYVSYVDSFARNGYVVFKLDYRGHGNSEGNPTGAYGSNGYTIDVLNAVASVKRSKDPSTSSGTSTELSRMSRSGAFVDPNQIGMWGHSMGGHITLESMIVSKDIKVGVIWAGVVGSYKDLYERWRRRNPLPGNEGTTTSTGRGRWRQELASQYGDPSQNPEFWNSLSATSYLSDISGPIQLHHGTSDSSVPITFSQILERQMKEVGKEVELYTYEGDDHNLSKNFSIAMNRSVEFFDKYLK